MKEIYSFKYLFTLLLSVSATLQAQNFKLIDINKAKNSNPDNYQNSSKNMFAELNGVFYFSANDGVHGAELYKSNGKAEGTGLVKDIYPGTASSNPYDITASGDKIYILASDSTYYQNLLVSDGTDAGTKVLHYPSPGLLPYLQNLTDVNGSLYFIYSYYDSSFNSYNQLWKTNGTDSGTVMVANLNSYTPQLVNVDGTLFFTTYNHTTGGFSLCKSNGTTEGTTLVAGINFNNPPSNLTVLNGLLYFAADNGTGNELWLSDGSAAGTHAVKNKHNIYFPVSYGEEVDPFTIKNNTLFFQGYAFDSTILTSSGYELCKYNTSDTNNNIFYQLYIIPREKSSYLIVLMPNFGNPMAQRRELFWLKTLTRAVKTIITVLLMLTALYYLPMRIMHWELNFGKATAPVRITTEWK